MAEATFGTHFGEVCPPLPEGLATGLTTGQKATKGAK